MADVVIAGLGSGAAPRSYTIQSGAELVLKAVRATFDGTAAAGAFLPCVRIVSPGGEVVGEYIASSFVAAGASASCSFFPGGGIGGAGAITSQTLVAYAVYAPAAGFITVTSTTEAAPTAIVTSPSFTADGLTQYRVDFGVAAVDIAVSVGGTGAALLFNLYRDSTDLGRVSDYNVLPNAGSYGSIPIGISVFDTPPSGSHTYGIKAWKIASGGATTTVRVYGDATGPPYTGVTHPGYIAVLQAVVA